MLRVEKSSIESETVFVHCVYLRVSQNKYGDRELLSTIHQITYEICSASVIVVCAIIALITKKNLILYHMIESQYDSRLLIYKNNINEQQKNKNYKSTHKTDAINMIFVLGCRLFVV